LFEHFLYWPLTPYTTPSATRHAFGKRYFLFKKVAFREAVAFIKVAYEVSGYFG